MYNSIKKKHWAKTFYLLYYTKKKDEQIIGVIKLGFLMSKGQLEITIFEAKVFIEKSLGKFENVLSI